MVYKVQGLPGTPRGEVVARFDAQQECHPRPLSLHSVEGEKVSFTTSTSSVAELVGVWDFARNRLAAWTCFGVLEVCAYLQVTLFDGSPRAVHHRGE